MEWILVILLTVLVPLAVVSLMAWAGLPDAIQMQHEYVTLGQIIYTDPLGTLAALAWPLILLAVCIVGLLGVHRLRKAAGG